MGCAPQGVRAETAARHRCDMAFTKSCAVAIFNKRRLIINKKIRIRKLPDADSRKKSLMDMRHAFTYGGGGQPSLPEPTERAWPLPAREQQRRTP